MENNCIHIVKYSKLFYLCALFLDRKGKTFVFIFNIKSEIGNLKIPVTR